LAMFLLTCHRAVQSLLPTILQPTGLQTSLLGRLWDLVKRRLINVHYLLTYLLITGRMRRRAARWKMHARTVSWTCASKLGVRSNPNDLTLSFVSMSQPATDMNDGAFERAWRCAVQKMIASDWDPFNGSIFQRNQCCKWLMHATSAVMHPTSFSLT
jgi:hypothetical protein